MVPRYFNNARPMTYDQAGNTLGDMPQQVGMNTITGETIWSDGSIRTAEGQIRVAGGTPESVSYLDSLKDQITSTVSSVANAGQQFVAGLSPLAWLGIGVVVLLILKEVQPEREMARSEYKRIAAPKRKQKRK